MKLISPYVFPKCIQIILLRVYLCIFIFLIKGMGLLVKKASIIMSAYKLPQQLYQNPMHN